MAFDINGFNYTRGFIGSSASNNSKTMHFYNSPDSLATILTPGYFPVYFGLPILVTFPNDTIRITASDGVQDVVIVDQTIPTISPIPAGNPFNQDANTTDDVLFNSVTFPSTGAPSTAPLNYNVEIETVSLTVSGPFAPQVISAEASRIGNQVTLTVPAFQYTQTINNQAIQISLPAWILPSSGARFDTVGFIGNAFSTFDILVIPSGPSAGISITDVNFFVPLFNT